MKLKTESPEVYASEHYSIPSDVCSSSIHTYRESTSFAAKHELETCSQNTYSSRSSSILNCHKVPWKSEQNQEYIYSFNTNTEDIIPSSTSPCVKAQFEVFQSSRDLTEADLKEKQRIKEEPQSSSRNMHMTYQEQPNVAGSQKMPLQETCIKIGIDGSRKDSSPVSLVPVSCITSSLSSSASISSSILKPCSTLSTLVQSYADSPHPQSTTSTLPIPIYLSTTQQTVPMQFVASVVPPHQQTHSPTSPQQQHLTDNSQMNDGNSDSTDTACITSSASFGKYRKARYVFSPQQLEGLEKFYQQQTYLGTLEREEISNSLHIPDAVVRTWWQNRRVKARRDSQKEKTSSSHL